MSELADLQRAFAEALATPRASDACIDMLDGPEARTRRRLRLYRGNRQVNAAKALGNAYPVIAKLVGEEFFAGLAYEFGLAHPSASGDLNEHGEALAAFVEQFAPAAELGYLADVARLEWALHRAHYAADAKPLEVARLAAVAPEHWDALRITLHPACALLASRWPVATIWRVHQPEHVGELDVDLTRSESVLVLRPGWRAIAMPISSAAYAFLGACVDGCDLATSVSRAIALDAASDLPSELRRWIADTVVVDFRLDP